MSTIIAPVRKWRAVQKLAIAEPDKLTVVLESPTGTKHDDRMAVAPLNCRNTEY
jgi:hypothetical protein